MYIVSKKFLVKIRVNDFVIKADKFDKFIGGTKYEARRTSE